jgi:signal transduction histidine kinase
MGRSIARTIVEAHNGLIWRKTGITAARRFRIRLPLAG